jgi:isopropylmalate/homocitrate/citramalate synthase
MKDKSSWQNNLWFTSPWNFEEEVTKQYKFPEEIKIHDITLRDGEQQAGIILNRQEKVEIAKKLDKIGVHRIEAGMPAVSSQDEAAIKEINSMGLKSEIFAFSRCMTKDIKAAHDCGVKGVVVEIPSSEHIVKYAYGWDLDRAINLSIESTKYAHELGLYTVFFPIDATRADINWFLDLIEKIATEGHMDALAVVDTFGVLNPHAVPYLMKKIRERLPDTPLEPHFHDDFGMGVANTVMAIASGGSVAHTTVSGIGERAGNSAMEDVVLTLKTMYGLDIGIKTEEFFELSKYVLEKAKITVQPNRPIVGKNLFNVESGIITGWVEKAGVEHLLEYSPFAPELVGQKPFNVVVGKYSGLPNVKYWLEKLGLDLPEEKHSELLTRIKEKSLEGKSLLTESEFKELVKSVS